MKSPRTRRTGTTARSEHRGRRLFALLLFVAALAARLLFWQATPDAAWPYTAYFKGDAPVWLEGRARVVSLLAFASRSPE